MGGMKRVLVAVLLVGVVVCAKNDPATPVMPTPAYPSSDVFEDLDTSDAMLLGVVHGPDGRPAAGADVFADAYFRTMGTAEDLPHDPQATTTDSRGRFVFRDSDALREEARRTRVKIWAERDDLVASQVMLRVTSLPEIAQILTLGPALLPKVKIVDQNGKPVVNVLVKLTFTVPPDDSYELNYMLGALSGTDGLAVFPRLPDREDWHVQLNANAKDKPYHVADLSLRTLGGPEPVTVRLRAGCTVRGHLELPDGSPAARASISVHEANELWSAGRRATVTDSNGYFVLRGVPTERVILTCEVPARGKRPFLVTAEARVTREFLGKEGGVVDLETLRLVKALSISGVVLNRAGKPAAHGCVMAEPVAGKAIGHAITAGGRFEVTGLDPGRHTLTATIYESGFKRTYTLEAKLKDVPAGTTDVVIRVTGGGNLIVLFHPMGKPNEPLEVWEPEFIAPTQGGSCLGGKRTEIRRVFESGRYRDFAVEAEGYREKMLGPVEIHADRPTFIDVELEPAKQSGR